jgi:hypothetical protein
MNIHGKHFFPTLLNPFASASLWRTRLEGTGRGVTGRQHRKPAPCVAVQQRTEGELPNV